MKHPLYSKQNATALLPLLEAITREIQERTSCLERIEGLLEDAAPNALSKETVRDRIAQAATQRRELRLARAELERLGCSIVGTQPITIRIPGQRGSKRRSFVFQTGDPVLR